MPEGVTTDKVLLSLRRERQMQKEKVEKEQLKKRIAAFKKNELRTEGFGIRSPFVHNTMKVRKKVPGNKEVFKKKSTKRKKECMFIK